MASFGVPWVMSSGSLAVSLGSGRSARLVTGGSSMTRISTGVVVVVALRVTCTVKLVSVSQTLLLRSVSDGSVSPRICTVAEVASRVPRPPDSEAYDSEHSLPELAMARAVRSPLSRVPTSSVGRVVKLTWSVEPGMVRLTVYERQCLPVFIVSRNWPGESSGRAVGGCWPSWRSMPVMGLPVRANGRIARCESRVMLEAIWSALAAS